jgi:3-methyladenine DNA glycosylase AlkD
MGGDHSPIDRMRLDAMRQDVRPILAWLDRRGTARNREGMARYGIRSAKAFGVSMATMQPLVKRLGRNHDLALALWETGWLEARVLAGFLADPAQVSPALMDRWCRDFDNWAVCDSTCIHLFSRTPHAWRKVPIWSRRTDEFVRRAGFALLAALAVHDKRAPDAAFARALALVEAGAGDSRNFVKKAVNWALRQIGKRNRALNTAAIALSRRLAARSDAAPRWIGKNALRELTSPAVMRRLAAATLRRRR